MRLIELDVALEGLEDLNAVSFYEENEHSKEAYMETKDMLKALPTVDAVTVKHGRKGQNMMMLTEREFTIGIVMYVLGKVIGFGFGWLASGKDGDHHD